MKVLLLVLNLLLVSICTALGQSDKAKLVEEKIMEVVTTHNVPAISVGLLIDGEKEYVNMGHFNRSKNKEVSEHSIYQIASLGKMFVGIIVHNLVLKNLVTLDQSITDFLSKDYPQKTLDKLKKISIGQLLHHQSGLPRDVKYSYKRKDGDSFLYDFKVEDFERELSKVKIKGQGDFQYSNFGYGLLAFLMENASGKTYEELLGEYVTAPNRMKNTVLTLKSSQVDNVVTPYRKDKRQIATSPWRMGKMAPPSATYSTTEDLLNLIENQLMVYNHHKETIDEEPLYLSKSKVRLGTKATISYGYGLFIGDNGYHGHGGDMDGYGSEYSFSIKHNSALVLLTSSGGKWVPDLILAINKILNEN